MLTLVGAAQAREPIAAIPPLPEPSPTGGRGSEPATAIGTPASAAVRPAPTADETPLFILRAVRLTGGDDLPSDGFDALIRPYIDRPMSLADIEQLRWELTKHLVDLGYINSGVIVEPGQRVHNGELRMRIISGRLDAVRIQGNGRLRANYIRARIQPDPDAPLHLGRLTEDFQLLLDDPLIGHIHANLLPGPTPGSAVLDLDVERARPWEVFLRLDNQHPPSTGAEFAYLGGTLYNLTGFGDLLDLYVGVGLDGSGGLNERGREGSVSWSLPLNARDLRLSQRFDRTNASLLQADLRDLDIKSDTERFEIGLSYPILRGIRQRLAVGLLFSRAENSTTLLGEPFSFSPGAVRGNSRVSALRLGQDYLWRGSRGALGLRSVFSLGVDAFNATIHGGDLPDSRFFAWLGQLQYVRDLAWHDTRLVLRASAQLTPDRLLALERYAIGGADSVRGYRENELVGDSGYAGSIELRWPLWRGTLLGQDDSLLELAAFTDAGSAWSNGRVGERNDLFSVGAGLRLGLGERLYGELYWGNPLTDPVSDDNNDDLQDQGIHFLVQVDI